jgi:hypothetical protein
MRYAVNLRGKCDGGVTRGAGGAKARPRTELCGHPDVKLDSGSPEPAAFTVYQVMAVNGGVGGGIMRQIKIEFDDEEMAQLEAAARARHIDPERMSKAQLLKLLTLGKKPKWRAGLSARRNQLALRAAQGMPSSAAIAASALSGNGTASGAHIPLDEAEAQARQAKRMELLSQTAGMWKGVPGKPQDGLAYQLAIRAEWP